MPRGGLRAALAYLPDAYVFGLALAGVEARRTAAVNRRERAEAEAQCAPPPPDKARVDMHLE